MVNSLQHFAKLVTAYRFPGDGDGFVKLILAENEQSLASAVELATDEDQTTDDGLWKSFFFDRLLCKLCEDVNGSSPADRPTIHDEKNADKKNRINSGAFVVTK